MTHDPFASTPRCQWPDGCTDAGTNLVTNVTDGDLTWIGKRVCSLHLTLLPGTIYADLAPAEPVCDFCSAPWPKWALYCVPFTADILFGGTSLQQHVESEVWGACDDCRVLLEARDASGLIGRVIARHGFSSDLSAVLDEFYEPVFATMRLPLAHEPAVARECLNCHNPFTRQRGPDSVCDRCGCITYDTDAPKEGG